MRTIVIGETTVQDDSRLTGQAWFRYPVPDSRVAHYAQQNEKAQLSAPGDYNGADQAEVGQLQTGKFVEVLVGEQDRFDPSVGLPMMQAGIAHLYQLAYTAWLKREDERFAYYGTSFDGTVWSMNKI